MLTRSAFTGVALAALVACAPKAEEQAVPPAAVDTAAVVSAVVGYWPRWIAAATRGDMAALAALVSDSVRIDSKGMPPMVGKGRGVECSALIKTTKVDSEVDHAGKDDAISNVMAYETGNYTEAP